MVSLNNKLHFKGPLSMVSLQDDDPMLDENSGVYVIWYRGAGDWISVAYVGEVSRQPVKKRLEQHLANCHNPELRDLIAAHGQALQFCFIPCRKGREKYYERKLINLLSPETNRA